MSSSLSMKTKTSISLSMGYGLTVGCAEAKPPRSAIRRLRRQVRKHLESHDEFSWEHFLDERDFDPAFEPWAAVELWQGALERVPDNTSYHLLLAGALVETGELDRAVEVAGRVHAALTDDTQSAELMVKILDVQNRDYRAYPWAKVPKVAKLDGRTRTRCYQWVSENGAVECAEMCDELFAGEVMLFEVPELATYLAGDARFDIEEDPWCPMIALRENRASVTA